MNLLFLHGPPATGKYTIANELKTLGSIRNFHNHLTIDVAKALYQYGTDPCRDLIQKLRLLSIEHAALHSTETICITYCYSHPDDLEFVEAAKGAVSAGGGRFIPVYLHCELQERERRVNSPSRAAMNKIQSVDTLKRYDKRFNCVPIPDDNCFELDVTSRAPDESAKRILEHYNLA